jgi:hypothetical protein
MDFWDGHWIFYLGLLGTNIGVYNRLKLLGWNGTNDCKDGGFSTGLIGNGYWTGLMGISIGGGGGGTVGRVIVGSVLFLLIVA